MNAFTAGLLWGAFQVTLFTLVGLAAYLVARRRGPAAGSLTAACCLLMAVGVSALALAPWPRWYTLAPPRGDVVESPLADGATAHSAASTTAVDAAAAALSAPSTEQDIARSSSTERVAAAWQGFWRELGAGPAPETAQDATPLRWPALVGAAFLAGLMLALARLALGLAAVRRLRAKTQPIDDGRLQTVATELCRRLNAARPVELRESRDLDSPATIGWRRPLVILPNDWREWTDAERRVVLAHEIAHISRGDYLTGLLSQFSLALHFYHPLIHWLARRLRLEQELAADALGAEVAGGRETYLITLAQMALRQDDRAIAWAARPFLPSRGAFLRRIEMLRDPRQFRSASLSRGRQIVIVSCVAVLGLLFAGVRGPVREIAAQSPQKPTQAAPSSSGDASNATAKRDIDWSYIPPSAAAVVMVRPAEIVSRAEMQPLLAVFNEQFQSVCGLRLEELAEVQYAVTSLPIPTTAGESEVPSPLILLFRAAKAHDWKKFGDQAAREPVAATFLGKSYVRSAQSPKNFSYYLPDDRTIVLASEPQLQRVLALSKTSAGKPDWAADWLSGEAGVMVNMTLVNAAIGPQLKQTSPQWAAIAGFAPLWEQTERLFLSAKFGKDLQFKGLVRCGSEEHAQNVSKTLEAALTLVANSLGQLAGQHAAGPNAPQATGAMLALTDLGTTLIKQTELKREGTAVHLQCDARLDAASTAVALLAPAVMGARTAARRSQSMNNMKQLMLAMHNYADVNKHFPAAVIIGPDGKTPHSWRIEMLPYVDQAALYQQYKMDEPWDSENNKKVLEQMPAVFRHPAADPNSKDASYFAITGETTIFPGMKPSGFADIRDGTSNTIMLVEAQRPIPWTKPEDIPYDPAKPLPKFGGYEPRIFVAALADGSVRNVAQNVDEKILRASFTKAGGEPVQLPLAPGN